MTNGLRETGILRNFRSPVFFGFYLTRADLRHSHVAYLINKGIEPLLIKERVGHKDIRITLNTYGHLYPNQQRRVADLLDNEKGNSPDSGNC